MTDQTNRPDTILEADTTDVLLQPSPLMAVIDLGSNSFRILICHWRNGELIDVVRSKEIVQIARGMDSNKNIDPEAVKRALKCLHKFRTLIDDYQPTFIQTIATQALRNAANAENFIAAANKILGVEIDIISPAEEAEFGYLGVRHFFERHNESILVIDIGGASTELSLGKNQTVQHWHSLELGCVSLANMFFDRNAPQHIAMSIKKTYDHCNHAISEIEAPFLTLSWDAALGASGTMRVMMDLIADNRDEIHRDDLEYLLQSTIANHGLPISIPENLRKDVLPAGIALLSVIFDRFGIDRLIVSSGSVKQGAMIKHIHLLSESTL